MKMTPLLLLMLLCGFAPGTAVAQHVHGVIELGVVVEEGTVAVSLNAPMSDVVGFEHEPDTEEQVEKIQQAALLLADADAMFGMPESANCEIADTSIDAPVYVKQHLEEQGSAETEHSHDPHDAHHSHDDHDDEEHSEIVANYEWVCGDTSKLDALALRFTDGFASVETIEVQVLTPAGAQVIKEEGRVASIPLSPS